MCSYNLSLNLLKGNTSQLQLIQWAKQFFTSCPNIMVVGITWWTPALLSGKERYQSLSCCWLTNCTILFFCGCRVKKLFTSGSPVLEHLKQTLKSPWLLYSSSNVWSWQSMFFSVWCPLSTHWMVDPTRCCCKGEWEWYVRPFNAIQVSPADSRHVA